MQEQPPGVQSQLHVGDAVRDRLMPADRLAELPPVLRERHDLVELAIHDAEVLREQAGALPGHRAAEDRGAIALRADAVALVHRAVLESHVADGCAGQPDLVEVLAARQPGRVSIDHEGADAEVAVRRLGQRVDEEAVGDRTVGDVGLGAGQQVAVAVANRRVLSEKTSEPASASVIALAPTHSPLARRGSTRSLSFSPACSAIGIAHAKRCAHAEKTSPCRCNRARSLRRGTRP